MVDPGSGPVSLWALTTIPKTGDRLVMIAAVQKALADRRSSGTDPPSLRQAFQAEEECRLYQTIESPPMYRLLAECFTDTAAVTAEAARRGYRVGRPRSLPEYDFLREADRRRCLRELRREPVEMLILAFPCSCWSSLMALNPGPHVDALRESQRPLVEFAVKAAKQQMSLGKQFLIENPATSAAWRHVGALVSLASDPRLHSVIFDPCELGLVGRSGQPHRKRTRIVTSSGPLAARLQKSQCSRRHVHELVIGGSVVTRPAGWYPPGLVKAIVDVASHLDADLDFTACPAEHVDEDEELEVDDRSEGSSEPEMEENGGEPPVDRRLMAAVMRLHENTGHRPPRALARALRIAGAAPDAIRAARQLKCDVCQELRRPRLRRPATLPRARTFGDVVHLPPIVCMISFPSHAFLGDRSSTSGRLSLLSVWCFAQGTTLGMLYRPCSCQLQRSAYGCVLAATRSNPGPATTAGSGANCAGSAAAIGTVPATHVTRTALSTDAVVLHMREVHILCYDVQSLH